VTPPLFLVAAGAVAPGVVHVGGDEGRHAADVRRLRAGETVWVGDGAGTVGVATVVSVGRGEVTVDVTGVRREPRPEPAFVVAQALAKGGRDEDALEAMTEVGVDTVLGWQSARSIAKWTDRTGERWRATARAAAKQSRRAWVPDVDGPFSTRPLADRVRSAALAVVLYEDAQDALAAVTMPEEGQVLLVVGPEGGVAPEELDALTGAGARACRLGPHVLRTSTAGVAALSVLSAGRRWR
jgi:16S rRNA (uracil1498-N3)-methyltransferase